MTIEKLVRRNRRYAKLRWGSIMTPAALDLLRSYSEEFQFSAASGDLLFVDSGWYVTNSGLTRLARRNRWAGVQVPPVPEVSNPAASRWAFQTILYKSRNCTGLVWFRESRPVHGSSP